ncbi:hypothetical protein AOX55_00006558 (plasmid) [Sinorhizobium fredii CCBAU 25509]|nr:hypothetical protein AOX55_00006558 [Sinorhizobium fredii CCBAU 25509]
MAAAQIGGGRADRTVPGTLGCDKRSGMVVPCLCVASVSTQLY